LQKIAAVTALAAQCLACQLSGAWAEEKREVGPAVLIVRQPAGEAVPAQALLGSPIAPPDGSEARPFTSLRSALQAAPAGALLRIGEGIWRERLSISRPVVLLGRGADRTRIVPPEGGLPAIEVRGADRVEIYGLSIEGGGFGISYLGGAGHRLENVSLRGAWQAAVQARGAHLFVAGGEVAEVARGRAGRGIDVEGGSLEAHKLLLRQAGRRALVLKAAKALLVDLDVQGSSLSALQATDGAEVRVVRGRFAGQGGAALYTGGARLSIEEAEVSGNEYAVIGFRGADLSVTGAQLSDYHVAAVAMVNSRGTVQRCKMEGGGTEAAISITGKDKTPVALLENRIRDSGSMGVHLTETSVVARGNIITGTRLDRDHDMGDAFYAVQSELQLERNVLRGNAGSGIATLRSRVRMTGNDLIENGRAGLLLLDRSRATATGNLFERNAAAGVEVAEQSHATLSRNRFAYQPTYDIDARCERGGADVRDDNTFAAPRRQRSCAE